MLQSNEGSLLVTWSRIKSAFKAKKKKKPSLRLTLQLSASFSRKSMAIYFMMIIYLS